MTIVVKKILENEFEVIVNDKTATSHTVTLSDKYYERLTKKKISKEKLLEYSFKFLLARETNTSILSEFELSTISRYFPEYEIEIKKYYRKN